MSSIPFDITGIEMIKYMPVDQILAYCKTSRQFSEICRDIRTWRYLLYRDFTITDTSRDPKQRYIDEMNKSIDNAIEKADFDGQAVITFGDSKLFLISPNIYFTNPPDEETMRNIGTFLWSINNGPIHLDSVSKVRQLIKSPIGSVSYDDPEIKWNDDKAKEILTNVYPEYMN